MQMAQWLRTEWVKPCDFWDRRCKGQTSSQAEGLLRFVDRCESILNSRHLILILSIIKTYISIFNLYSAHVYLHKRLFKNKKQLQFFIYLRKDVRFIEYFYFMVVGVKWRTLFLLSAHYHELCSQPVLAAFAIRNCINNLYMFYSYSQWKRSFSPINFENIVMEVLCGPLIFSYSW